MNDASLYVANRRPAAKKRVQKRMTLLRDVCKNPFSYLILLPAFAYTFIFGYLTLPYVLISFQKFSYQMDFVSILKSEWVGFENFEFFFSSPMAWRVTRNTLFLNLLFIAFTTFAAILIALLFNELRNKYFIKISQSLMLLPSFLSWMVVSYIVYALLSTNTGVINRALQSMGLENVLWYSESSRWPAMLTAMRVWKGAGMSSIVYLAAITGIDGELYEAARVDGAGRIKALTKITLPLLFPMVCIMAIMAIGGIFRGDFGMIYAIIRDNGVLYPTTDVIDTYIFRALRTMPDASKTMAIGLYQSFFGFIFVFGSNWAVKRFFKEGALF
jgi:putative aldouronate transport system permease protein